MLVLGLDGATWELLDPLAAVLPNLSRLARAGCRAPLRSTVPPMTLPAWSSILTGVNPGRHGILDFLHRIPGTYQLAFLDARSRCVPTIHEILSGRGRRVASIAVPTTWPPTPVNGIVVSGFDSPVSTAVRAAHCAPRSYYPELRRRFGGLRFADFQEGRLDADWHRRAHAALLREIGRKEAVCADLLAREDWDLFMVVFGESDTVSHHFWAFHDPRSPRFSPGRPDLLVDVYRRLDAAVGRLAQHADIHCVVSDHGFGGAGTLVLYLNRFLEAQGWLRFGAAGRARWGDELRRLALRLPVGGLVNRLPDTLLAGIEAGTRLGGIDFAYTRAWSDELNYAATVHLNLQGRDPLGTIGDAEAATRELTAMLLDWRVEGRPVVERVWRRAEVFRGPAAAGAPDLVLDLALCDGYSTTLLPSSRVAAGTIFRHLAATEYLGGKGLGMNGAHRPEGVLILAGGPFGAGGSTSAAVEDVAPTLLHALGEDVPGHMEGTVLAGAFRVPTPPARSPATPAHTPRVTPRSSRRLRKTLTRLGYLDS